VQPVSLGSLDDLSTKRLHLHLRREHCRSSTKASGKEGHGSATSPPFSFVKVSIFSAA
jgi:hypothetical protein